jgi:hypothetical protein
MPLQWNDLDTMLSREFIIPSNKDIGTKIPKEIGEELLYVTAQIAEGSSS